MTAPSKTKKVNNEREKASPYPKDKPEARQEDDDAQNKDLQEELEELMQKMKQGTLTEEDKARQKAIEAEMANHANATAHTDSIPAAKPESESTQPMETDSTTNNTEDTERTTTQPNKAAHSPDSEKTYGSYQKQPLGHANIKQEHQEESKLPTSRLLDDLNMEWDIDLNKSHGESSLQNVPKDAFGHIVRNSRTRYCIRYGSGDARSARFESILPNDSKYTGQRDVTQSRNRIVEKIVQHHRENRTPLPMNILSQVTILLVYWDCKMGVGHDAEVEVLAPDFVGRRPHTRCLIHLPPNLYSQYNLPNDTGYSHETRSIIKLLMEGNNDRQKSINLYNIAVNLENKFEEKWMRNVPGRPAKLSELIYERKAVSRRTKSPCATTEQLASPTLTKPPVPPREPTLPPKTRQEQTPIEKKSGMSLREQFHKDFLELFDLAENTKFLDLPEELQVSYTAQFTKWKKVNS